MVLEGTNISLDVKFTGKIIANYLDYSFVRTTNLGDKKSISGVLAVYEEVTTVWEKSSYNTFETINSLVVKNSDTTNHQVTIYISGNPQFSCLLEQGEYVSYTEGLGFQVKNVSGLDKAIETTPLVYTHTQDTAEAEWLIEHGLGYFPLINIEDDDRTAIFTFSRTDNPDFTETIINFDVPASGKAYCK